LQHAKDTNEEAQSESIAITEETFFRLQHAKYRALFSRTGTNSTQAPICCITSDCLQ
jgi:hypothetical protein